MSTLKGPSTTLISIVADASSEKGGDVSGWVLISDFSG